jgi:hypothetical protein
MPSDFSNALLGEWWQRLGLGCGNENERRGSSPISGQSASNFSMLLLQRATGFTVPSSVDCCCEWGTA